MRMEVATEYRQKKTRDLEDDINSDNKTDKVHMEAADNGGRECRHQ